MNKRTLYLECNSGLSGDMFTAALRMLRQKGFIGEEDKIAYLSGSLGKGNGTTFLEINQVKEVFNKHYRFHLPDTGI